MKKQSSLKRLLSYAGGYKYLTYSSLILSAISAIAALAPFVLIWRLLKEILTVYPNFEDVQNIVFYASSAVIVSIASIIIYCGALMCSHLSAFRIASNIRSAVLRHIFTLPLGFSDDFGTGKIRRIIDESSGATETYLAHQLPDMAGAIATPVGLIVLLFVFDFRLGILSLIPIIIAFALLQKFMTGPVLAEKMKEYTNALERMSNEAVEYVRGIPVVKTFGQTIYTFERFKAAIDDYSSWALDYTKNLRLPMMFYTTLINSTFAFLIFGSIAISRGQVTADLILNFLFYVIITPIISITLTKIMFLSENIMIVKDALERIDSILNISPLSEGNENNNFKAPSIEFKNVSFSYDKKKNALKDISFKIAPGKTIALVGPSGGGKSTIASLIPRFYDVDSGEILISGINVKDIPKKKLMEKVSFVFQDSRLLKTSVLENVRLAKPDASEDEVIKALNAASCQDIIEKLPDGINTVIGSGGIFLSGGEQQRIAIARAILKDAPIVLLDEATAFADPDNEDKILKAFENLSKGKTVVMIAHRLSAVKNADEIFVIDNGKIAERGAREKLLEKNGLFAKMLKTWQSSVGWKIN